ncbi:histidine kinase [Ectobacillus panaciterrae]|uniref:sensor histidine kinase n=1 Tax=Ectobacillus panaciterrae TaxID=363872 RepID=UPI00041E0BE6
MLSFESFSIYIVICVLAPLVGAFILLFLFIFEKRIDSLENQARELALEQELQKALYNQLNQQIQPHFFFNTLNVIMSLARLDRKRELIRAIEVLSMFMKFKYRTNDSLITIEDELRYTNYYLEIQRLRFGERLQFQINVEDETQHALTPPFLLQTLVENSFKHAFEKQAGPARLIISIHLDNHQVSLIVWNSAVQSEEAQTSLDTGYGIQNIKNRLRIIFPNSHTNVSLTHTKDGTSVEVIWPLTYSS